MDEISAADQYSQENTTRPISPYVPVVPPATVQRSYSSKSSLNAANNENDNDDTENIDEIDENYINKDSRFTATTGLHFYRQQIGKVLDHIVYRLVTVLLILVDIILAIISISVYGDQKTAGAIAFDVVSLIFSIVFAVEVSLRIFSQGQLFISGRERIINIIDSTIVYVSLVVNIVILAIEGNSETSTASTAVGFAGKLLIFVRIIRAVLLIRIVRLLLQGENVKRATRYIVSENKRRYQKDGFDLDLCYVTPRLIAMSFPSEGLMSLYRNPINQVAKFFNETHAGSYRIYNLCSERAYDEEKFANNVVRVRIDDHNVPTMAQIFDFVKEADEWMKKDERNVMAIHCKGGKGRTGTMVCIWLLHSGQFQSADDSLGYFGARRTDLTVGKKFQGVQTPSQSRYVGYYKMVVDNGRLPPPVKRIQLKTVTIKAIQSIGNGDGSDLIVEIFQDKQLFYEGSLKASEKSRRRYDSLKDQVFVEFFELEPVAGDVKFRFRLDSRQLKGTYDRSLFYFWFNTSFLSDAGRLELSREEIDNAHRHKYWTIFLQKFSVILEYVVL